MSRLRLEDATRARIDALWPTLLSRIASGAIIGRELEASGLLRDDVRAYLSTVDGARKEWDEARVASADAFFDDAVEMTYTGRDAKLVRAQADLLLRFAARRSPREYSERTNIDMTVKTLDLTAIIQDAQRRLQQARSQGSLIDHATQRALPETRVVDPGALVHVARSALESML